MVKKELILLVLLLLLFSSCKTNIETKTDGNIPTNNQINSGTNNSKIANPASVFCIEKGGKLEIRTASDGSQSGYCIFSSGKECEEWAYFRGECSLDNNVSASDFSCSSDSDCVPAECCHPSSCINKAKVTNCGKTICTLDCKPGTLDCGQGNCNCENNNCVAKILR